MRAFAGLMVLVAGVSAPAAAEAYTATAQTALSLDRGLGLVQTWSATCEATDPAEDAALAATGRDLRFFAAPEQPLEVGVEGATFAVDEEASGRFIYAAVPGARVIGRLTVRCGTADVFDQVVVDSAPITVAPLLEAPARLVDAVSLAEIDAPLVSGEVIEFSGLAILANPRGSEVIDVHLIGAGVDLTVTLGPTDFVDGRATLSPQVAPTEVGDIVITAELLGVASEPLAFIVVADDGDDDDDDDNDDVDVDDNDPSSSASGCAAGDGTISAAVIVVAALRRRRRPSGTSAAGR